MSLSSGRFAMFVTPPVFRPQEWDQNLAVHPQFFSIPHVVFCEYRRSRALINSSWNATIEHLTPGERAIPKTRQISTDLCTLWITVIQPIIEVFQELIIMSELFSIDSNGTCRESYPILNHKLNLLGIQSHHIKILTKLVAGIIFQWNGIALRVTIRFPHIDSIDKHRCFYIRRITIDSIR